MNIYKFEEDDLYLRIPLQFFADSDEKTEEPTAKRKKEAREKGQVPKSTELNSAIVLLFAFILALSVSLSRCAKSTDTWVTIRPGFLCKCAVVIFFFVV